MFDLFGKKTVPSRPSSGIAASDGKIYGPEDFKKNNNDTVASNGMNQKGSDSFGVSDSRTQYSPEMQRVLDRYEKAYMKAKRDTPRPDDISHFWWFPCEKNGGCGIHSFDDVDMWQASAHMFPMPSRPNDRYYQKGEQITQNLGLKVNRKMVMNVLSSLGYKEYGNALDDDGERWWVKNPEGIKLTVFDASQGYVYVSFDAAQRTNRVLFDLYEELENRLDCAFSARFYLDNMSGLKPKYDDYAALPYVIINNQWERCTLDTYPNYINLHHAKLLYLFDDNVPELSYDRMWRFQNPDALQYYEKPENAIVYKEWRDHDLVNTDNPETYYANFLRQYYKAFSDSVRVNCVEVYPTEEAKKEAMQEKLVRDYSCLDNDDFPY